MNGNGVVLVVEDDPAVQELVKAVLSDEGYEVRIAANGALGLDAVTREPVKLILLDMRMPVMDGWAFARTYRETTGPHAPIVVLTAARDASHRAAEIAADGYVAKPFDIDDLLAEVERHLQ